MATILKGGILSEGKENVPDIDPVGGLTMVGNETFEVGSNVGVAAFISKKETVSCKLSTVDFFSAGEKYSAGLKREHINEELTRIVEKSNNRIEFRLMRLSFFMDFDFSISRPCPNLLLELCYYRSKRE
jgi:hypothetical protein